MIGRQLRLIASVILYLSGGAFVAADSSSMPYTVPTSISPTIASAPTLTQALPSDLAPVANLSLAAADPTPFTPQAMDSNPGNIQIIGRPGDAMTTFSESGTRFDGRSDSGLRLRAIGYDGHLQPVPFAVPMTQGNRVSYDRGNVTEWYQRGPLGVEQGFTLAAVPRITLGADHYRGRGSPADRHGRSPPQSDHLASALCIGRPCQRVMRAALA